MAKVIVCNVFVKPIVKLQANKIHEVKDPRKVPTSKEFIAWMNAK